MSPPALTASQRLLLKSQAHALNPVVLVGAGGLTPAVQHEIDRALNSHGLIKVRITGAERDERRAMAERIEQETGSTAVQQVGHVVVLFREPPADRDPGSRAVSLLPVATERAPLRGRNGERAPRTSAGAAPEVPRKRMSRTRITALKKAVTPRSGTFLVPDSREAKAPRKVAAAGAGAGAAGAARGSRGAGPKRGPARPAGRPTTRSGGRAGRKSAGGPRR